MNFRVLLPTALIAIAAPFPGVASFAALTPTETVQPAAQISPSAQESTTKRQVLEACVQNRAETLPNPFVDVPADHWAFKAVLTMHYCGAFRQATPQRLIDRLVNPPQQSLLVR